MKRLILILLASCGAVYAQQNAVLLPWTPQQFTNTNGTVLANGKVCTYQAGTSTGQASYTDATATVANNVPPNAILLDSTGRANIWLKVGLAYKIVTLTAGSDNTCNTGVTIKTQDNVTAGNAFLTANNTFTGTNTFTGLLQCKNFEQVQCVDSTLSRGGSDIGAELNLAYAALPASGGVIWLFPKSDGTNYIYSTPIVFATSVKPVRLECYGASTPTLSGNGACVLNYTPTTATAAITLDYGFNGSGSGIEQNHGIQNVTFVNNNCVTPGGCGSSASGVKIGGTNGGAGQATFRMRIVGFGTGFDNTSGPASSWGYSFQHSTFIYNTTGMNLGAGAENMTCMHCQFVSNSVHFTVTGGESNFYATSFDGHTSTVGGINLNWNGRGSPAKVEFVSCHFEKNNGNTNDNHYIVGNGNYTILGGVIDIDSTTGNQDFYFQGGGAFTNIIGLEFNSSGQTASQIINSTAGNTAMRGEIQIIFFGLASVPTICGGTGNCAGVTDMSFVADVGNGASHIWSIEGGVSVPKTNFTETTAPTASANNDLCYGDSTAHALKCSYNNGSFFNLPLVGTANTWTGNQSFNSGTLLPSAAGGTDLGSTALPFGNLWLGTAATNNFKFAPASTAAARVISIPDPGVNTNLALNLTATSAAFATATTAGTCVQNTTAVSGAATTMAVSVAPVSTPGVGAVWSGFVSSAGNVTINECAVATSAGGTIAFNIRVTP